MELIKSLVNNATSSVRVYLVDKSSDDYSCYLFPNTLNQSIKSAYCTNFNNFTKDRNISDYDNIHTEKGTIQKAPIDDIEVWIKVKSAIDIADADEITLSAKEFSDEYYMIVICFENTIDGVIKQTFLVAQYKKIDSWYKKSVKFGFIGDTFKEKNEDIFVLNGTIDCVILDNQAFILQESQFERLFKYNKKMRKLLTNNQENIESCSFLDNPEEFNSLILNNKAATKKMARFFQKKPIDLSALDPSLVKNVLSGHAEFDILQYNNDDKIIVDKKSRDLIVDIISGKYLRSLFGENIIQTKGV